MKITEYPQITTLSNDDVAIIDGAQGTRTILASTLGNALLGLMTPKEISDHIDLSKMEASSSFDASGRLLVGTSTGNKVIPVTDYFYDMIDAICQGNGYGWPLKRKIWRWKHLGSSVTDKQWSEIGAGTFKGMFLGDYWGINDVIWRIVDINYWINTGDTPCTTNHLVIMPDSHLFLGNMNNTDTTEGGYVNSLMYTYFLKEAKKVVDRAFGTDHILNHRELLVNSVIDGYPASGVWCDSTVELPNEPMMYGSYVFTSANDGVVNSYRYTIDKSQLAALNINPSLINSNRNNLWLRDSVSSSQFAGVDKNGYASAHRSSNLYGVRPVFGIKAV